MSKSVLKKKVKFETSTAEGENSDNANDEEEGYEADTHQANGAEKFNDIVEETYQNQYDDEYEEDKES